MKILLLLSLLVMSGTLVSCMSICLNLPDFGVSTKPLPRPVDSPDYPQPVENMPVGTGFRVPGWK